MARMLLERGLGRNVAAAAFRQTLPLALMVEAAGVEPDIGIENAQLIDSENDRIGMISRISKSAVRSLYSLFPEFPELPKLHIQTAPTLAKEHSEVLS
jgi:hypothetical protein